MKYAINLLKEPNQSLSVNLTDNLGNTYAVDIDLRSLNNGLICANVSVNDEMQCAGRLCNINTPLLLNDIINGNLYFTDLYGNDAPDYKQFNDRFLLVYDTEFKVG